MKPNIEALVKKFNKELNGEGFITVGKDIPNPFKERISTGSIGLDCVTGGGLPRGGFIEYYGDESSGKTSMSIRAAREFQKKFGEDAVIAYVGVEGYLDLEWAESLGLQIDDTILNLKASDAEVYLDTVVELINSNEVHLVIIDSLPALASVVEKEKNFGDSTVAILARLNAQFCRKGIWGAKSPEPGKANLTTILAINQLRSKIGGWSPTGDPTETPGGRAIKFAKMLSVQFRAAKPFTVGSGTQRNTIGKEVVYRVTKAKSGCHEGGVGQFSLYYDKSHTGCDDIIDFAQEYRVAATRYGVFQRAGAYVKFEDKNYKAAELEEKIKTDVDFREDLRQKVINSALTGTIVGEEEDEQE